MSESGYAAIAEYCLVTLTPVLDILGSIRLLRYAAGPLVFQRGDFEDQTELSRE